MRIKKLSDNTVLISILIIIALSLLLSSCNSEKVKNQKEKLSEEIKSVDFSEDSLSSIDYTYDGTKDSAWLQAVQNTGRVMSENQFTYDRKGIKKSLEQALDGNRHGDCAHLVSWSLQEYGILEKGEHFYSNSSGSLSCSKDSSVYSQLKDKCEIIDTGGISCSDTEKLKEILHVGDICCYNLHMNVVAGISKKGDILYYDAGLVPTRKESGKIYR